MGFQRQVNAVGGIAAGLGIGSVVGVLLSIVTNVMSIWLYLAWTIGGAIIGGMIGYRRL